MIEQKAARAVGIAGMGLGLAELVAPGWIAKQLGLSPKTARLLRAFGVREVMSGVGTVARKSPTLGLWSRVAGDAIDLAALGAALKKSQKRGLMLAAIGGVLAISVVDVILARRSLN
jgi:hypothetical protein